MNDLTTEQIGAVYSQMAAMAAADQAAEETELISDSVRLGKVEVFDGQTLIGHITPDADGVRVFSVYDRPAKVDWLKDLRLAAARDYYGPAGSSYGYGTWCYPRYDL